jgi:hypothetical protein
VAARMKLLPSPTSLKLILNLYILANLKNRNYLKKYDANQQSL